MKKPIQLNENHEWGITPRQQHRFYSIFGSAACCQILIGNRGVTQILELYEM